MHASILAYMFNLVEEGKISVVLNPSNPVNNQGFIQEYVANLLKSAFPHLQEWVSKSSPKFGSSSTFKDFLCPVIIQIVIFQLNMCIIGHIHMCFLSMGFCQWDIGIKTTKTKSDANYNRCNKFHWQKTALLLWNQ